MLTLVSFSTTNCPHCKPVKQVLTQLESNFSDEDLLITPIVIDEDDNIQIARHWGVQGVPTVIAINRKEGEIAQEVGRYIGSENITLDALTYCVNSYTENSEQGNLQSDVLSE